MHAAIFVQPLLETCGEPEFSTPRPRFLGLDAPLRTICSLLHSCRDSIRPCPYSQSEAERKVKGYHIDGLFYKSCLIIPHATPSPRSKENGNHCLIVEPQRREQYFEVEYVSNQSWLPESRLETSTVSCPMAKSQPQRPTSFSNGRGKVRAARQRYFLLDDETEMINSVGWCLYQRALQRPSGWMVKQ